MNIIPFKLRQLGIADAKALVMTFAMNGAVKFPEAKPMPAPEQAKQPRHKWANKKERTDYYNLQSKIRRAGA